MDSLQSELLVPFALLSLYRVNNKIGYVEISSLKNGSPTEFRPLTEGDARLIAKSFIKKNSNFVYRYNPNVLFFEKNNGVLDLIFRTEPTEHFQFFSKSLKLQQGKRPVPGLVWVYNRETSNHMHIYAYKEWNGEKTELFNAPFMNCSGSRVCLGSSIIKVSIDKVDVNSLIEEIVIGFFASAFSHASNEKQITVNFHKHACDILGQKEFPLDQLISANCKVKDII